MIECKTQIHIYIYFEGRKLMTIRYFLLLVMMSTILIIVGCSNSEEETIENDEDNTEETDDASTPNEGTDEPEIDEADASDEEDDYRADLGNLEIWIGGEVIVEEDQVIVEGKSNLLPGSHIASSGVTDTFASTDLQDSAEVEEDGSFYFEFPGRESNVDVTLSLSTGDEQVVDHYGEHLKDATGNQVYETSEEGEYSAEYTFEIDTRKKMPYTIDLETPDWSNVPDDYGDTDVWMEVDATTKHNYLYFEGKSNLLEGSKISGNITDPNNLPSSAWSFSDAHVNPDGSFQLQIHYWDIREGMQMHFEFDPDNNSWDNILDTYGDDGENLEGDLVEEKDNNGKYIKLSVDLDGPEISAPKDVDLSLDEEEIRMQVPDDLLFDFDKSDLKSDAKDTLDEIIKDVNDLDTNVDIKINGHTDDQGEADYNLSLSEDRAQSVADYIEEQNDTDSLTLDVEGFGDTEPIASNKNEDEREKNRRVEIIINPE